MRGLGKCPEGWGSSRSCEGQSQSLSCGGNRAELTSVFPVPRPSSAGETLAGLRQDGGEGVGPRNIGWEEMWPLHGQGRHLLSADGSRNSCPFSAGKLPQGIVLG